MLLQRRPNPIALSVYLSRCVLWPNSATSPMLRREGEWECGVDISIGSTLSPLGLRQSPNGGSGLELEASGGR